MSACVSENEVQALLAGRLTESRIAPLEEHVDACASCQLLLSAGVRTTSRLSRGWEDARTSAHFTAGEVIAGRYEIKWFIARGGMGEVYAALDRMVGEEIALKVLMTPAQTSPATLSRLRAEVQLARRVTNPHVSRVFDIGSSKIADGSEILFLTMQLLRGETLRDRLKREGALPPAEVWRLADDMFAALSAAHQMGIVHSDFKSDNVMLVAGESAGRPRAVVMDFGLARVTADGSAQDAAESLVAGTLAYMAPEQRDGGTLTAAADVYALGVVLYEMLTGVLPPFRTAHGKERAQQPPPPKRLEALDIPVRWKVVIARCLARDPRARFKNVIELQAALDDDGKRAPRRGPFAATAIVAIGVGLALGGVYWKAAAVTAAPPSSQLPPPTPIAPRPAPAEPRAAAPSPAVVATTDEAPSPVRAPPSRKQPRAVRADPPAREPVPPQTREADASSQLRAAEEKLAAGDIAEACGLGQAAAKQAPGEAATWEFLGRCYMRLPDPRRARAYYREYLARAPAGPKASFIRAIVEREQP
jgi:serine/threonine protein kinase